MPSFLFSTLKTQKSLKYLAGLALLYFYYLLFCITWQYRTFQMDVAFLAIKQEALHHSYYATVFFTHVFSAIFLIGLGALQFSNTLLTNYKSLHRKLGKAYVGIVLFLAAPTGLVMGVFAMGGFTAQIAFVILSILWFFFTYKAIIFAKQKNVIAHKHFMMRSYALTLSAISLRLFKWILANTLAPAPMDMYCTVAWAGWLFNWAIVECWIWKNRK
jgi:uncharacterized membrane protein